MATSSAQNVVIRVAVTSGMTPNSGGEKSGDHWVPK
jgi:hypothetical protein